MNGRMLLKESFRPILLTLFLAMSLVFAGCSSDDYDAPNTADSAAVGGAETNVLIEPATLKGWMDEGLVNNDDSFNQRVVVIDYGPYDVPVSDDTTPRIKGACKVAKGALIAPRKDGLATHTPLVATGDQMDAVIQNFGIEEDTVIVITSNKPYYATRAYWTFRYWGFPKEQIKVVNGFNDNFAAQYPDMMVLEGEEVAPS
ncbi:MAG TPA: hypothetical protein VJ882_07235, partial [Desulfuromonadales bacterium]|nr:hypothetical protein [Desulfuromonadales bacterium]